MIGYRMRLPDTKIETFIAYTKRLIDSKRFPHLNSGALHPRDIAALPNPTYPYLHWYNNGNYVYYGHGKKYSNAEYIDFSFDKELLGEL